MSFSEGCVGGVEPETVTLWRWTRRDGHGWMRHRLDLPGPWESQEFVPLSALRLVEEERDAAQWKLVALTEEFDKYSEDALAHSRLVEEELRQARDLRRRAEETRENANAVSLRVEGENRRLSEELRQAREERDRASTLSTGWAAESGRWEARYNEAVADRDRLAEALREIADQDWVENVLDPQWAARIAEAALSPVFQGASEVGRSESATPLHMGKDSPEGREQCREHVRGGGNHENAEAGSSPRLHPSTASPDLTDPPVQGEHEQGEPVWKNVPPLEDFMARIGMPLDGEHEQDRCPKCGAHEMSGYECPSPPCGLGEHEQDGEGWKREQQRIAERQARDAERDKLIGTLRDITRAAESERGNEFASLVGGWASSAVTGLCSVCNQSPCASPRVCCQASTALLDGVVSGCGEIAQDGDTEETT